jgi:hypothetical protein
MRANPELNAERVPQQELHTATPVVEAWPVNLQRIADCSQGISDSPLHTCRTIRRRTAVMCLLKDCDFAR